MRRQREQRRALRAAAAGHCDPRGLHRGRPAYPFTVTSTRSQQLLALPAALFVGHSITQIVSDGASSWSPDLVQALACVGMPLALASIIFAVSDGASGRSPRLRPGVLLAQQIAAFLVVDMLEHGVAGESPASALTSRAFWVALIAHIAAAGILWACLRASFCAGSVLVARARAGITPNRPPLDQRIGRRAPALRGLPLSSLSRRGPPIQAIARPI